MNVKLPVIEFIPALGLALLALICYIIASTVFDGTSVSIIPFTVGAYCWYSLMRVAYYKGKPWSVRIGRRK